MRVYLTSADLLDVLGKQLLELSIRIALDGKLELEEIKELRRWLRENKEKTAIPAVGYLHEIMVRITADGVIDRDELLELHLGIERIIPNEHRAPIVEARKKREAKRRDRVREHRRIEKEKEKQEQKEFRQAEHARMMRLRHSFAKVAGVSFANDNGSERQEIIRRCRPGEQLIFRHDAYNQYSIFATQILRTNGEQLGHAPEYLAEQIVDEIQDGYAVLGVLANVTGGTFDKPTMGVNFAIFFMAQDVPIDELNAYAKQMLAAR